jgi:hypothetical protein
LGQLAFLWQSLLLAQFLVHSVLAFFLAFFFPGSDAIETPDIKDRAKTAKNIFFIF